MGAWEDLITHGEHKKLCDKLHKDEPDIRIYEANKRVWHEYVQFVLQIFIKDYPVKVQFT